MTFFQLVGHREPIEDQAYVFLEFLVLYLAAVLEITGSCLCRIRFFHGAPVVAVFVVVEMMFNYGFLLLLKSRKILRVVAE